MREGLTFDDVLLVPQFSTIKSRSEVDVSVKLGNLDFSHPIIPANMKNVTGKKMAMSIIKSGGLAILHRFLPIKKQMSIAAKITDSGTDSCAIKRFAVSIGVKEEDKNNVNSFCDNGVRIICIDIAHGDSELAVDMIRWIRENHPYMFIIAGNVATGNAAERLWKSGADVVKVGIGAGSLCTTRIETGNGVPQLTAIMDVSKKRDEIRKNNNTNPMYIIADGGIKNSGDIVKALCFADMVMVGNLFAGCDEAPGTINYINGVAYKEYAGSSTHKNTHIEGVVASVKTKGAYDDVLSKLLDGVKSGCSYQGVSNLIDLRDNPEFIRITNAGLKESHPHDVVLK